ncbi:MAG: serine--tRNA ligase [Ktedonobacteraceae bacterium]|nr:serine--tRNA ligase [Ktedonobacteraceae bacterium]
MLSLDFVCQHPEVVREALRKRGDLPPDLDDILRLAEQRRGLIHRRDGLYVTLKHVREDVRSASAEKKVVLNKQVKSLTRDIHQLELQITDVETRLHLMLLTLPNLPHSSVVEGTGASGNQEIRRWGKWQEPHFTPQPHWELNKRLGIVDMEGGVRVAGSRFVALKGAGARLERALISFMLDVHTRVHGYTEVMPPFLTLRSAMEGAGQLPRFEAQAYACSVDDLYLNPTAEVPLVGMHSGTIFPAHTLPLRYAAWTTAFRREAGSSARQNRGLLRLHQFNKVELFQFVEPAYSYQVLEEIVWHAERILQILELPYRVVELCSSQLPFASSKTYDLEVWMPGLDEFVEISSVSNCETFQARRSDIKYRPTPRAGAEYVHTLNGSGLAVGRTLAAILENYQQADGSVVVPKVLRPYVGMSQVAPV